MKFKTNLWKNTELWLPKAGGLSGLAAKDDERIFWGDEDVLHLDLGGGYLSTVG